MSDLVWAFNAVVLAGMVAALCGFMFIFGWNCGAIYCRANGLAKTLMRTLAPVITPAARPWPLKRPQQAQELPREFRSSYPLDETYPLYSDEFRRERRMDEL